MQKTKIFLSSFAMITALSLISFSACSKEKKTPESSVTEKQPETAPSEHESKTASADSDKAPAPKASQARPASPESIAQGEKIFKKSGCTSCHSPTVDQVEKGLGPSFTRVAAAYKNAGGKKALLEFFGGNNKPVVVPEKYSIMKTNLRPVKRLNDEQRSDLADFILSF